MLVQSSNLLGLCLLAPASPVSISSSEESGGEARVVLSRRCSCWDRYWAGVCLAARAQWSSSLCRRGRFAWQRRKKLVIPAARILYSNLPRSPMSGWEKGKTPSCFECPLYEMSSISAVLLEPLIYSVKFHLSVTYSSINAIEISQWAWNTCDTLLIYDVHANASVLLFCMQTTKTLDHRGKFSGLLCKQSTDQKWPITEIADLLCPVCSCSFEEVHVSYSGSLCRLCLHCRHTPT